MIYVLILLRYFIKRLKKHEINVNITITNTINVSDYYCSYSVTEVTIWQRITSLDIKSVD
jgi:hypothetical protein